MRIFHPLPFMLLKRTKFEICIRICVFIFQHKQNLLKICNFIWFVYMILFIDIWSIKSKCIIFAKWILCWKIINIWNFNDTVTKSNCIITFQYFWCEKSKIKKQCQNGPMMRHNWSVLYVLKQWISTRKILKRELLVVFTYLINKLWMLASWQPYDPQLSQSIFCV